MSTDIFRLSFLVIIVMLVACNSENNKDQTNELGNPTNDLESPSMELETPTILVEKAGESSITVQFLQNPDIQEYQLYWSID